jgi:hypothetical protein
VCSPGRKGHDDLTSSPPSSLLAQAVPIESPTLLAGNYRQGLRSLRDLTQHLTARADDSHAAPCFLSEELPVSRDCSRILAQVRFLAYHRIKPHAPPLVRTPVNSFEFHSCERTPQVAHLTLSLGRIQYIAYIELASFTAWTTRVSNPVRSPRFRASVSVMVQ